MLRDKAERNPKFSSRSLEHERKLRSIIAKGSRLEERPSPVRKGDGSDRKNSLPSAFR
jgi:hypothetical protein